jgi:hypothetical protein
MIRGCCRKPGSCFVSAPAPLSSFSTDYGSNPETTEGMRLSCIDHRTNCLVSTVLPPRPHTRSGRTNGPAGARSGVRSSRRGIRARPAGWSGGLSRGLGTIPPAAARQSNRKPKRKPLQPGGAKSLPCLGTHIYQRCTCRSPILICSSQVGSTLASLNGVFGAVITRVSHQKHSHQQWLKEQNNTTNTLGPPLRPSVRYCIAQRRHSTTFQTCV